MLFKYLGSFLISLTDRKGDFEKICHTDFIISQTIATPFILHNKVK